MAQRLRTFAQVVIMLALALVVGAVIMLLSGKDPLNAYRVLLESAFGSGRAIANTLLAATPLIFTGMATVVAFRAGIFNVGVEGSLYFGAFAAAWVGFTFTDLPGIVLIPLAFVVAGIVGGLWGLIPGYLKARLRVDEVVTTIMLNYVAILFTTYLVNGPFFVPGVSNAMSKTVAPQAQLARLAPPSQLNVAFIVALICAGVVILLFQRTTLGYELRTVGANPLFARWSGMPVGKIILQVMFISGVLGGLAGTGQVLGVHYRFVANFSPGFGFDGIAIALLGRNTPAGALLAALFLGALRNGGATMELFTNVPRNLVDVLQAIIIFFVAIDLSLSWLRFRRRGKASVEPTMGAVEPAK
ncbi:MAG: ABC transporter permease [Anaerolineae bacterium]|nr:ABC transporter permease [Anaerolineae bacterium]